MKKSTMERLDEDKVITRNIKDLIFSEKFSISLVVISFWGLLGSIVIFIVCGNWSFSFILNEEKIAQFGDFIGGVIGTLLALAASLLYYIALKEQQNDVKINQRSLDKQIAEFGKQVEELELAREVYTEQHKTMTDQYNVTLLQQFENNFFSYFNIYLKVKDQLDKQSSKIDYFSDAFRCLSSMVKYPDLQGKTANEAYEYTKKQYSLFFIKNREAFSHYFRTMYRLVTIVTSSDVLKLDSDKMKYIKIIRSQLTETELLLIYYDIHSSYSGKARQVFYEYNILKHLPPLSKIEIKNKYRITESAYFKLSSFIDHISPSIISYINEICDNPDLPDPYSFESEYEPLKCILKVEYTDIIDFSFVCYDMRIIPNNFKNILEDYICDLLFISQFKEPAKFISINRREDDITSSTVFSYKLPVDAICRIVVDKK